METLLGVDVGTTNTKAVAYSLRGEPLAAELGRCSGEMPVAD